MKKLKMLFFFISLVSITHATDIQVSQVEYVHSDDPEFIRGINVTISWKNSWHNDRNHDAAWVFFKFVSKNGGSRHAYLAPGSAQQNWKSRAATPDAQLQVAQDGTGIMVSPSDTYRGELSYRLFIALDTARLNERYVNYLNNVTIEGYGIEMVYIPEGSFTLGDPDEAALKYGAFYASDDNGEVSGLFKVEKENEPINVGPNKGSLYYQAEDAIYQGDQKGPIPAAFPKGVGGFYLMKYEVSQGIYADFLNTLSSQMASVRYIGGTPEYATVGGTIVLEGDHFVAKSPSERMVFWHWDDMMAFTDWAALRPYTELEYTKAARGTGKPQAHEMPWNTTDDAKMLRRINAKTHRMEMPEGYDESMLNENNRGEFGASHYWVMDLGGSMWEKVITVGDSVGRSFDGQHGDGNISYYGMANVEHWPSGYGESFGYGYRGGGYYGKAHISNFNPYSPIAYRLYGAWSGGPRNAAYGYRAARTLK
ncbi:hypothetical protein E1176_16050 [Fulvivirga sp. RKSG066]|uniref:SUMF1/EgtB/PvdO family nonheme iron enzyme n=1 Tax=Fulvivirga aurantia TaxID=2529383 RepID=UPI0012BB6597|nr:SUMF1/EgtB/PvdO family nonheme iron enzyme [Fulvivirga aurantia]MTI22545.1 hypothetical protein [Fulvivirga aurantia]